MKAAVLHEFDPSVTARELVRFEDVSDPRIERPDDVIVKIGGAAVCRTDLHIIEGIWQDKMNIAFPFVMGHENAGWVEEVGPAVSGLKPGDPVICHPLRINGECLACRRGNDMHAEDAEFPGLNTQGGYAEYLKTNRRALIALPQSLAPKDVARYTDAGLTAYHASKKAARTLEPGQRVVVIGTGGLGHIGIQCLRALSPADSIAVELAKKCGADHVVAADGGEVDAVMALTDGKGAEVVMDYVAEGDVVAKAFAMTRNAGDYFVIGYGGKLEIPTIDMIISERRIIGNLVGTYAELVELMELADRGRVKLATREYPLAEANQALHDLQQGRVAGRAVLIP